MIMNYGTEIQRLSRSSSIKLENFQGPIRFSRTVKVLKMETFFKDFQGPVATLFKSLLHCYSTNYNNNNNNKW